MDVPENDFDYMVRVNLKGTFFASQAVGRLMIERRYGRIINMSSQAGVIALPGEPIYCMTKAAINHLTRCLAVEWGPLQHHRQRRRADLHRDGRHARRAVEPEFRARHSGQHRARPGRAAGGGRGRGRLPRLPRRLADHRRDASGRRRLVGEVAARVRRYNHPLSSLPGLTRQTIPQRRNRYSTRRKGCPDQVRV